MSLTFDLESRDNNLSEAESHDFGAVVRHLKSGCVASRKGWNGRGMWLLLVEHWAPGIEHGKLVGSLPRKPWIAMRTADGGLVPWLASQTDILAEDWVIVTGPADVWGQA